MEVRMTINETTKREIEIKREIETKQRLMKRNKTEKNESKSLANRLGKNNL